MISVGVRYGVRWEVGGCGVRVQSSGREPGIVQPSARHVCYKWNSHCPLLLVEVLIGGGCDRKRKCDSHIQAGI